MKTTTKLITIILVFCVSAGFASAEDKWKGPASPDAAAIKKDLAQIERMYTPRLDIRQRQQAKVIMNRVVARLDKLAGTVRPAPAPVRPVPMIKTATPAQMNMIVLAARKSISTTEKQLVIAKYGIRYYFSTGQVMRLANLFTWDNEKLTVIEMLLPKVTDRKNAYRLENILTFNSSKTKLKKILASPYH